MSPTRWLPLAACAVLAACRGADGDYVPSCIAHAGETVTLHNGRFEWDRFTDERRLGEDGNIVDPFPGFPRTGDYRVDGARVEFRADDGERLDDRYLVERDGRRFLLGAGDFDAVAAGAPVPGCALVMRSTAGPADQGTSDRFAPLR